MSRKRVIETQAEVGEMIRQRMQEQGLTLSELAMRVAEELGEPRVSDSAVFKWLRNPMMLAPMRVFAIERVLECTPGTFSRHLGYAPLDGESTCTVATALEADGELGEIERAALLAAYGAAIAMRRSQRAKRAPQARTHAQSH